MTARQRNSTLRRQLTQALQLKTSAAGQCSTGRTAPPYTHQSGGASSAAFQNSRSLQIICRCAEFPSAPSLCLCSHACAGLHFRDGPAMGVLCPARRCALMTAARCGSRDVEDWDWRLAATPARHRPVCSLITRQASPGHCMPATFLPPRTLCFCALTRTRVGATLCDQGEGQWCA